MKPLFLEYDEVVALHEYGLRRFGGSAGVRDPGLLESALAQPMAGFGDQYLHADIFEMAAAYLFHIVSNHPFIDGNKRAGLICAQTFLYLNGHMIPPDHPGLYAVVIQVAEGKSDKKTIADFFRRECVGVISDG